jgi:hypothetical protein
VGIVLRRGGEADCCHRSLVVARDPCPWAESTYGGAALADWPSRRRMTLESLFSPASFDC